MQSQNPEPWGKRGIFSASNWKGNFLFLAFFFLSFNASLFEIYHIFFLPYYDIHRFLEVIIFESLALAIVISHPTREGLLKMLSALPTWVLIFTVAFFALGYFSAWKNPGISQHLGVLWVSHCLFLFLLCFYIGSLARKQLAVFENLMLYALLTAGGYYLFMEWSYYLLSQYFQHFTDIHLDTDMLIQRLRFPQFSNPRFLGQVLSFFLPLSVLPYLRLTQVVKFRWLLLILPIGLWQMFWMAQSRALYLELGLSLILLPLFFRKTEGILKRYFFAQIFSLVLGFLLYLWLYHINSHLPERHYDSTSSGRFDLWKLAFEQIQAHPFFGIGPLNFIDYSGFNINVSHPHNIVLFVLVEWGIPAGLIFLSVACFALYCWAKKAIQVVKARSDNALVWIALFNALLCGMINAQFSGTLLMPASQLAFSVVVGWAMGLYPITLKHPRFLRKNGHLFLILITLGTGFLLAKAFLPKVIHLKETEYEACINAIDIDHPIRCPIIPSYFADHSAFEFPTSQKATTDN